MAIFHLRLTAQSRKTKSVQAAAAYASGSKLRLPDGSYADYRRKHGIVHAEIISLDGKERSRQEFWDSVAAKEKRKDSCESREIRFSLPYELSPEGKKRASQTMARAILTRYEVEAVDLCMHEPSKFARRPNATSKENPHSHLRFPDRDIHGKKLNPRFYNNPQEVIEIRKLWADICNEELERENQTVRIDHRTYKEQMKEVTNEIQQLQKEISNIENIINSELTSIKEEIHNEPEQPTKYERPEWNSVETGLGNNRTRHQQNSNLDRRLGQENQISNGINNRSKNTTEQIYSRGKIGSKTERRNYENNRQVGQFGISNGRSLPESISKAEALRKELEEFKYLLKLALERQQDIITSMEIDKLYAEEENAEELREATGRLESEEKQVERERETTTATRFTP